MNEGMDSKFGIIKEADEIVFCENEPGSTLFFLQSGTVKITKIVGDKEKTLAIIGAGDIFGEMAILEAAPRSATAIVVETAKLLEFNKESFNQLVQAQPSIAIKLLKTIGARIMDQARKYRIINLPDMESKIMDVFLMLAEKKGINPETNTTPNIEFDIDTAAICNWAGISEMEGEEKLVEMRNQNKIVRNKNSCVVPNLYQFFRIVSSKRHAMEREKDG